MKRSPFSILTLLISLALLGGVLGFFYTQKSTIASWDNNSPSLNNEEDSDKDISGSGTSSSKTQKDIVKKISIKPGDTYSSLMEKAGVSRKKSMSILEATESEYNLARVKAGSDIELTFTPEEEFKKLLYQIDPEEQLVVTTSASSSKWRAEIEPIPYETEIAIDEGTITSSMYQTAQEKGIDIRAIIELADAFQWTVDFAMGTRKGDTFKFVYEKKYLDGEYVRPGKILAAQYVNAGEKHEIYHYKESEDNMGYFSPEGKSAQKMFLKAPVSYKYISSGYTTGPRYLARFRMYTSSHKAIDYAAESGTPIRAVGNGVVTTAGWNSSGYGYLTAVRHNSTYTTRYAHQSRILVRPGQRVSQGEVIGHVGNTGLSTGPHLHYEMIKYGQKTNPLNLELPPARSISEENMNNFKESIAPYQKMLHE